MFERFYSQLQPESQGNLLIIGGCILIFNSFGFISLNVITALIGLWLIWYGITKADYITKFKKWLNK